MTLHGRLVEYLENGRFICAHVQNDNGTRLRLLNQDNRETNLPHDRIIHISQGNVSSRLSREEIMSILHKTSQQREILAESIDLHEVWELVSEKPEENFEVSFLASLFFGNDPTDDQTAAFLRAIIANRLYFKYKSGKIDVHSPETVTQIKLKQDMEKEQDDFIADNSKFIKWIWQNGKIPGNWKERERALQILRDYYLFGKEAPEHLLAGKLIKKAQLTGPHDIFRLLVRAGIWDRNENIPLHRFGIPHSFSENVLAEMQKIEVSSALELPEAGRQDLRDSHLITIDGAATRDFDDALHLEKQGENFLVGIHISDVGYFVKPGTSIFAEALKRGTSIYFPEESVSMLPQPLAEEKLSLLKDNERPALSFLVLLSPTAEILRFNVVHSIVSVKDQLTYPEADRLVKQDNDLAALTALSKLLRQRRVNKGALLLPMPELHISIAPDDTITIKRTAVDTPSRVLVAEFMILANTLGAQFVAEREAPGLFRCQMEPRQRIIDGFEKDILKVIQQRKRLSPMSLLTTPKIHSGVGAPQYTTVTSPIRRLLDLIMQLQISHLVNGKGVLFSKNDMKRFANTILTTLEKANQVRHLRQRYWILKYLEPRTGERLPALVIDSGPRRVHIFLEEFLLDADLPLNPAFKVTAGDIVMVKISKVDPLGNTLKLSW
jgi:exoribonuclease-2